ncbi:Fic family protein [Streptomyces sp. NPDC051940]|uniref:Fic family protein n=1 Tax=Streptomyces sp. NPDC051940 TaxID=3155675 RepID=UPI0034382794
MLFETPHLSAADERVLGAIDAMRSDLRHQVRNVPLKRQQGLRQALTADAIAASNSIEGYRLDSRDVEDLLDGEQDVDASDENKAETLAYQQMMTYIQSLHDAPDFSYSKGQLNALHWMLQGHHGSRKAGQWRRGAMYVTDPANPRIAAYTAPDGELAPGLMAEFIDWLNEGDLDRPALIRAAMAHLSLVCIHPWPDGNGRMSRSVQTLLISREGILAPEFSSIEEWLGRPGNTWEFYKVLALTGGPVWSPDRDAAPWIRFARSPRCTMSLSLACPPLALPARGGPVRQAGPEGPAGPDGSRPPPGSPTHPRPLLPPRRRVPVGGPGDGEQTPAA